MAETLPADDVPPPPSSPPAAPPPQEEPPLPPIERRNRFRLSLVWLVPLLAVAVGVILLVRHLTQVGPEVVIEFRTAEGLEAGRTEVRYKEVVVGRLSGIGLSEDRQRVLATVQLNKDAAGMAVADSRFWVVRPRVGLAGVSGLGTLLSGAYIGVDAGSSEESRRRFVGLEAPPYVLRNEPGRRFVLHADELGSLDIGSPVYYRGTRVGRVVGFSLEPSPDQLTVQVFVESPNEALVTQQSRFWNSSGLDLQIGARGLTLQTESLASVVAGGLAFANPPGTAGAPAASDGTHFRLFADRATAMAPPDGPAQRVRMVFPQNARGLAANAPLEVLGVEVGQVQSVQLRHDARGNFTVDVEADLYPLRLGLQGLPGVPDDARQLLKQLVDRGMRAQLRTANLVTGQMYVALDFPPRAAKATLNAADPVPQLPVTEGEFGQLQPQVAQIMRKLSDVPFDQIGRNLNSTLSAANDTLRQLTPEARAALADVQQTLQAAQRTLAAGERTLAAGEHTLKQADRNLVGEDAPLQRNATQTLDELQRAAAALRTLADYLQRHPESLLRGQRADPPLKPAEPAR